ncbi:MAG: hypothetical protein KGY48_01935 [Wenzhouxiangellaceae bacterium]|nr:hypothetical protein [Wenzhouxiangellaceae bacterium]
MYETGLERFRSPAIALALSAVFVVGCGNDSAEDVEQTAAAESPRMIEREAPGRPASAEPETSQSSTEFRVVPDLEGKLEEDGMGLDTIIDGSSKSAYADSMAWIAEDVSAEQYDRLERSLRYIRSYDSSVLGNEQRFLATIDGKTGQELIDRANRLLQERRR